MARRDSDGGAGDGSALRPLVPCPLGRGCLTRNLLPDPHRLAWGKRLTRTQTVRNRGRLALRIAKHFTVLDVGDVVLQTVHVHVVQSPRFVGGSEDLVATLR